MADGKTLYAGWYQVMSVLVLQMLCLASVYTCYSVIALPIGQAFGASAMVQVLGVTVTTLAAGLLSLPLGIVIDRSRLRWLMAGAAAWFCLGFWVMSFATAMWQILAVYALFMAPATVVLGSIASASLLSRWFTYYRARALGLAASGVAIGGLLLPPLLQLLMESFEWRLALQVYGSALALVMLPVALGAIRDQPTELQLAGEPGRDSAAAKRRKDEAKPLNLKEPAFWLLAIALGCIFCGPIALTSNMLPVLLSKNIAASDGVFVLSMVSAANFAGKMLVAGFGDRVSHQVALAGILATLGLAAWVFLQATTLGACVLAGLLVGVSAGGTAPLWSLTLSRLYGSAQVGRAMGVMRLAIMPFTITSVPLLGWLYDQTGSYDVGFRGYMVLAALGCVFILVTGRKPTPSAAPSPPPES